MNARVYPRRVAKPKATKKKRAAKAKAKPTAVKRKRKIRATIALGSTQTSAFRDRVLKRGRPPSRLVFARSVAAKGSQLGRRMFLLGMWFRDLEHHIDHNSEDLTEEIDDQLQRVWKAWLGNVDQFARIQFLHAIEAASHDARRFADPKYNVRAFDPVRAVRNQFRTYAVALGVAVPDDDVINEALAAWRMKDPGAPSKAGGGSKWNRLLSVCKRAGFASTLGAPRSLKSEWDDHRPGFRLRRWHPPKSEPNA